MKKRFRFNTTTLPAICLVVLLCSGFLITFLQMNRISTDACYRSLKDAAEEESADLTANISSDQELLRVLAGILSGFNDMASDEVRNFVCSFTSQGMISSLGLLLPDSTMLLCDGRSVKDTSRFDYKNELEKAPYLSGVNACMDNLGCKYLYHAIPVIQNNETAAILYGFVRLDTLGNLYPVNAFDGSAALYVIDRTTGDIILNTKPHYHKNIFNFPTDENAVQSGGSPKQIRANMTAGIPGSLSVYSKTSGECLYAYYEPVAINEWMILLTVPEQAAFKDAVHLRHILWIFSAVNILAVLTYFLGILHNIRRDNKKKERQLAQSLYMLDIQQTLFDAHQKPELIGVALKKCAKLLHTANAFLITLNGTFTDSLFFWSERTEKYSEALKKADMSAHLPYITSRLLAKESVSFGNIEELKRLSEEDYTVLNRQKIHSLIMTPVLDSGKKLTGILGAANFEPQNGLLFSASGKLPDVSLLECVSLNFFMAVNNLNSYRQIKEMGTVDMLTGLLNRNKYEADLNAFAAKNFSVGCIYMDANGLHELNNCLGHAAGDDMLRLIGSTIKEIFGREGTYRVGGDEFVILCRDLSEDALLEKTERLKETLFAHHCHVSVGKAYQQAASNISHVVSDAEHRMYEAKRKYYEEKGDERKTREMNQKLEKILLEKKDYDSFLSIISSYFLGVYVVDLNTDLTRSIYKPSYFASILQQTEYRFMEGIRIYADTYVHEEDRPALHAFINYEKIEQSLNNGETPELHYRKMDSTYLFLRVYPATDFGDMKKDTFWLFEQER